LILGKKKLKDNGVFLQNVTSEIHIPKFPHKSCSLYLLIGVTHVKRRYFKSNMLNLILLFDNILSLALNKTFVKII